MSKQSLVLLFFVSLMALLSYVVMQDDQIDEGEILFFIFVGAATVYMAVKSKASDESKFFCGLNVLLGAVVFIPASLLFLLVLLWRTMESSGGAWHL